MPNFSVEFASRNEMVEEVPIGRFAMVAVGSMLEADDVILI